MCDSINAQGGCATVVWRYLSDLGWWDGHVCGMPFNNFPIDDSQGYFIQCSGVSTWQQQCEPAVPSPLCYELVAGYNFISLPRWAQDLLPKAQDVLDSINAQGGCATVIWRYLPDLGWWDGHAAGMPFNNYDIECRQGYFIQSSCPST